MKTLRGDLSGSNTSIAIHGLRDLIFKGQLGPGTDHLESELATTLGMSRTPVREALLVLEAQGLIDVRPRKGARIKPMTVQDITEVYDILTSLESLAAAEAASRNLKPEDLAGLANLVDSMQRAKTQDDLASWATLGDQFNREVVRLGGNARAAHMTSILADQLRRPQNVTLFMQPGAMQADTYPLQVLAAIRSGDAEAARNAQSALRRAAQKMMIEAMDRHRLSSI